MDNLDDLVKHQDLAKNTESGQAEFLTTNHGSRINDNQEKCCKQMLFI